MKKIFQLSAIIFLLFYNVVKGYKIDRELSGTFVINGYMLPEHHAPQNFLSEDSVMVLGKFALERTNQLKIVQYGDSSPICTDTFYNYQLIDLQNQAYKVCHNLKDVSKTGFLPLKSKKSGFDIALDQLYSGEPVIEKTITLNGQKAREFVFTCKNGFYKDKSIAMYFTSRYVKGRPLTLLPETERHFKGNFIKIIIDYSPTVKILVEHKYVPALKDEYRQFLSSFLN